MEEIYEDTDVYFWQLKHSLDEGWGYRCRFRHGLSVLEAEKASLTGNPLGVNAYIMRKLGYTTLVETETAIKKEIDWSRTKVLAVRGNYIWINLKGCDKYGIVDPKDKYALEEIIKDLLNYRDEEGKRVICQVDVAPTIAALRRRISRISLSSSSVC